MTDKTKYKTFLRGYLSTHGITPNHEDKISCLISDNHKNGNRRKSAQVFDDHIYCHGCGTSYDVFDCVRILEGKSDFKEQLESVQRVAGDYQPAPARTQKKRIEKRPIALEEKSFLIKAGSEFESSKRKELLHIPLDWIMKKYWLYRDDAGRVYFAVVRYEPKDGSDKSYRNFWTDGMRVYNRMPDGLPHPVYNKNGDPQDSLIIVAGEKCADALTEIIPTGLRSVTFLGGEKKAKLVDWSFTEKAESVYIWRDNDDAGRQFATDLMKLIPRAKMVNIPQGKPNKWDAWDAINNDGMGWEEISGMMENNLSVVEKSDTPEPPDSDTPTGLPEWSGKWAPRILGYDNDNNLNIITGFGSLAVLDPSKLTKNKMLTLAPLHWWRSNFIQGEKITDGDVQDCVDYICTVGSMLDFEPGMFRGRGAWREKSGKIAYNDGRKVYGEKDKRAIYLRKQRQEIGLEEMPAAQNILNSMMRAAADMPFETPADMMRAVTWATLAPFCGALPFRPPAFLTGASSTGKTSILNMLIRPLSDGQYMAGSSTKAGISQRVGTDSAPVILDEAESDTDKQSMNKDELFTLIRESTTEDAPIEVKGSTSGKSVQYQRRSMFFLAGISPEMKQEADFNRFVYVSLGAIKRSDWTAFKKEILSAYSEENCRSVRSLMWSKLESVVDFAEAIADRLEAEHHRGSRYSTMHSLILATWIMIFLGHENPSEQIISEVMAEYMSYADKQEHIDDSENFFEKIMTYQILVDDGSYRRMLSVREIANAVRHGELYHDDDSGEDKVFVSKRVYNAHLKRNGLAVTNSGELCISNNHDGIMKMTGHARGYARRLWRFKGMTHKDRVVSMESGKQRRCTVFGEWE